MSENEKSKLERTIDRDKILSDVGPLWESLHSSAQRTCEILRGRYGNKADCTVSLNDNDSRIRVIPKASAGNESHLEIRINRDDKKLITRINPTFARTDAQSGQVVVYQIVTDGSGTSLCFSKSGKLVSAIELVEHEICERLLNISLG